MSTARQMLANMAQRRRTSKGEDSSRDSACQKFFDINELVEMVLGHLDLKELAHMQSTCRNAKALTVRSKSLGQNYFWFWETHFSAKDQIDFVRKSIPFVMSQCALEWIVGDDEDEPNSLSMRYKIADQNARDWTPNDEHRLRLHANPNGEELWRRVIVVRDCKLHLILEDPRRTSKARLNRTTTLAPEATLGDMYDWLSKQAAKYAACRG